MAPQTCIKMCFHSKTMKSDASVSTVLLKTQTKTQADAHRDYAHREAKTGTESRAHKHGWKFVPDRKEITWLPESSTVGKIFTKQNKASQAVQCILPSELLLAWAGNSKFKILSKGWSTFRIPHTQMHAGCCGRRMRSPLTSDTVKIASVYSILNNPQLQLPRVNQITFHGFGLLQQIGFSLTSKDFHVHMLF